MLIDLCAIENERQFDCDICVVGAGPAGIALADRLRGSGLSILLVESGGFNLELGTQGLYQGQREGAPYFRLDACRWRMFGGSSVRWGGWCKPLQPNDYTQRDWLPLSGWPISALDLQPYHDDAAALFELPNAKFDLASWAGRLPKPLPLDGADLVNGVFQHSPETDFGRMYRQRLVDAPNVTVLVHANVTQLRLKPGTAEVGSIELASLNGMRATARPRAVVLACGGIENARLLLASQADRPAGLGNEHDMVGRCFMEHLHVPVGHILAHPGKQWSQAFFAKAVFDDVRLRGVLIPSEQGLQKHRLLSTSIAIEKASFSFGTPFVGWPPQLTFPFVQYYREHRFTAQGAVVEYIKHTAERFEGLPRRFGTWIEAKKARSRANANGSADQVYSVYFRAEQAPDPANRIMLDSKRDALGVPRTKLIWSLKPLDVESVNGWTRVLDHELRQRDLGRFIEPAQDWTENVLGGPHHMGSTRMSADERQGVVDQDCRVHSVNNLYVAGSSVFATSGYVNPTYTIVLLALRLADALRKRLEP